MKIRVIFTAFVAFILSTCFAGAATRYEDLHASALSPLLYPSKVQKHLVVMVALDDLFLIGRDYKTQLSAYTSPGLWTMEVDVDGKSQDLGIARVEVLDDKSPFRLALYPKLNSVKKGDAFRLRLEAPLTAGGSVTVYHSTATAAIVDLAPLIATSGYSKKPEDYVTATWRFRVKINGRDTDFPASSAQLLNYGDGPKLEVSLSAFRLRNGDSVLMRLKPPPEGKEEPPVIDVHATVDGARTPVPVPGLVQPFTFSIEPKQGISADLLDGRKVDVGRLEGEYTWPSFDFKTFNGYFTGKSTLSTNNLDTAGRIELKFGIERFLSAGSAQGIDWPMPAFLEIGVIGNQAFTNQSFVSSLGMRTLLPVASIIKGFGGTVARVPEIDLAVQYANLFKQDSRFTTPSSEKNMFRLTSGLDWKEVKLFGSDLLQFDLNARAWYFPDKRLRSGLNLRSIESVLDIAVTIPLKLGPGKVYNLKLSYLTGAQESNNFARTATFGIGIELKK